MKLRELFTRTPKVAMQTVEEATEVVEAPITPEQELSAASARVIELQMRQGELRAKVEAGKANEDEFAEYGQMRGMLTAAEQARRAAEDRAYRARQEHAEAEARAKVDAIMVEVGNLVPRLQLQLAKLNRLRGGGGTGTIGSIDMQKTYGVSFDFSLRLIEAIADCSREAEWDVSSAFGGKSGPPKPKGGAEHPLAHAPKDMYGRVHVRVG